MLLALLLRTPELFKARGTTKPESKRPDDDDDDDGPRPSASAVVCYFRSAGFGVPSAVYG